MGTDADTVGSEVARLCALGARAAGFIGTDDALARVMAEEMLGGLDELLLLAPRAGGEPPD